MPHAPRSIAHLATEGRTKHYGIAAHAPAARPALAAAVRDAAPALVPPEAYAITIAHDARTAALGLVYWWAHENELLHRVLVAPLDDPGALELHEGPEMACVWELEVLDFERRAWLRHVLVDGDHDAYLRATLDPVRV